jgi:hypothetical protein
VSNEGFSLTRTHQPHLSKITPASYAPINLALVWQALKNYHRVNCTGSALVFPAKSTHKTSSKKDHHP